MGINRSKGGLSANVGWPLGLALGLVFRLHCGWYGERSGSVDARAIRRKAGLW